MGTALTASKDLSEILDEPFTSDIPSATWDNPNDTFRACTWISAGVVRTNSVASTLSCMKVDTGTYSGDQYGQCIVQTFNDAGPNGGQIGVTLRNAASATDGSCYIVGAVRDGTQNKYSFAESDSASSVTAIESAGGADTTAWLTDGDTVHVEIVGTATTTDAIRMGVNTGSGLTEVFTTEDDAGGLSGGRPGVQMFGVSESGVEISQFIGGDIVDEAGAEAALTGTSSTSAVGSATNSVTVAVTGVVATAAVGAVGVAKAAMLAGVLATGAVGSLNFTESGSTSLTTVSGTSAVGDVGQNRTVALTGTAATAAAGDVAPGVASVLTGTEATSAVGTVGAEVSGAVALTGVAGTSAAGSVGFTEAGAVGLTGTEATAGVGSVGVTIGASVALTGVAGTSAAGSTTPGTLVGLSGEAAIGAVGSVAADSDITVALTGTEATAGAGSVGFTEAGAVGLTGTEATAGVGSVGVTAGASVALTGTAATSAVGSISFTEAGAVGLTGTAATSAVGSVGVIETGTVALTGAEATSAVGSVSVGAPVVLPTEYNQLLVTALKTDATVDAIISGQVYSGRIPDDKNAPAVVYQMISRNPARTLAGPASLDMVRVQVGCWTQSESQSEALVLATRNALEDVGFSFSAVVRDTYEPATERFGTILHFWFAQQHVAATVSAIVADLDKPQIVTALKDDATVDALISGRVFPRELPPDQTVPALVYYTSSQEPASHMQGSATLDMIRTLVECWTVSKSESEALASAARSALETADFTFSGYRDERYEPRTRRFGITLEFWYAKRH